MCLVGFFGASLNRSMLVSSREDAAVGKGGFGSDREEASLSPAPLPAHRLGPVPSSSSEAGQLKLQPLSTLVPHSCRESGSPAQSHTKQQLGSVKGKQLNGVVVLSLSSWNEIQGAPTPPRCLPHTDPCCPCQWPQGPCGN